MNYTSSQSYHTLTHWQSNKKKKELTVFIPWGFNRGHNTIPWGFNRGQKTLPWGEYSGDYTIPWMASGNITIPWAKWEEQTS